MNHTSYPHHTAHQRSHMEPLSKNVANHLLSEVHEGLKTLEKPPHLVGLLANNDLATIGR
jgi:hypothetical protein